MLPVGSIETVEKELSKIVGDAPQLQRGASPYYHSTEFFQHPQGRQVFEQLCRWIAEIPTNEHLLLTMQTPIAVEDTHGELARAQTLVSLIKRAHQKIPQLRIVVYEQRRGKALQNADKRTIREAVSAGQITRNLRIEAGKPSRFHCLWVPDAAAYAFRRQWSHKESRWFGWVQQVAEVSKI